MPIFDDKKTLKAARVLSMEALQSASIDSTLAAFSVFLSSKMGISAAKGNGKEFVSHAPGYWPEVPVEQWNDWKWQLKNRVTSLAQLEQHIELSEEERAGVLLSGDKLALAVTPHFFNLIPRDDPADPIRRQVIPRIERSEEHTS